MEKLLKLQEKLIESINSSTIGNNERDYPIVWELVHMASVTRISQILAEVRGESQSLAAYAATCHDFGRITTGKQENHAEDGFLPLKNFLKDLNMFNNEEIEIIANACKNHSNKNEVGNPIEEIVKDADILDTALSGHRFDKEHYLKRLEKAKKEVNLNG